ncbi:hypothetical protein L6164_031379 [Bauhinia variegata]|uniref:Uncharacterized protein n=1 Tax=Bauhinia variegata TaxID=167791 RepID=A0ACB9LF92_BAUVA|nr:hypothetical protein L6164_031379 [Bauhinia variegata]
MARGGSSSSSNPKISALIVEDHRPTSMLHEAILKRNNMETKVVNNGKHAVELHSKGERFDVIFMDYNMPEMNGAQATKKLREMGVRSMIVGVTSCTDFERVEFMAAGLDKCFKKGLTRAMVEEVLQKLKE